jgi:hypothetical protein
LGGDLQKFPDYLEPVTPPSVKYPGHTRSSEDARMRATIPLPGLFLISILATGNLRATALGATPEALKYYEERLSSLANARATYFDEYTNRKRAHPMLPDPTAALGARAAPPLFHFVKSHVAFINKYGSQVALVVDGKEGPHYDLIFDPQYAPDGTTLIYRAGSAGKWFLNIGGKELTAYQYVDSPVFSADGKHMAYLAVKDGKWLVVA